VSLALPELVGQAGQDAAYRSLEFFTSCIPNPNTRGVYGQAVREFCAFCTRLGVPLEHVPSPTVAAWVQAMAAEGKSAATVNVKLSGVRQWLDWLARHGVIKGNPASPVHGIKRSVREGKTPVLEREQARALFASLNGEDVVTLRDKAIMAVMLFGFVRVGAVVRMRVGDFENAGDASLVLHEKGGRERRIPCHHRTRDAVRAYLTATGLLEQGGKAPLFQPARARSGKISGSPMHRRDVLAMVKRRCKAVGLPTSICNHSFRATGITIHQENGGRLEDAQELAGHADPRTTQLYNRKNRSVARAEVERVQL
jgi:site-specific recombinase XerD